MGDITDSDEEQERKKAAQKEEEKETPPSSQEVVSVCWCGVPRANFTKKLLKFIMGANFATFCN